MTVRINKQKINLREKLTEFEDKVNFDEVVRGLGEYAGNVGIGTANPGATLHVNGTSPEIRLSESGSSKVRFRTTGDNYINTGQNVGIGTTDPSVKFEVVGNILIHNNVNSTLYLGKGPEGVDGVVKIKSAPTGADSDQLGLDFFTHASASGSDNTSFAMRITHDAKVGIGFDDPGSNKLYVNGNIYASGTITPSSDDRVKHNEQNIVGAIETLGKITPKKYIKTTEMYEASHDFELDADGNPIDANGEPVEHSIEAGVIAQQVLEVPELAFMVSPEGVDEDGNVTSPHGLNYNSLFTYVIAAIQEQQQIIEDLKSRIETLESK